MIETQKPPDPGQAGAASRTASAFSYLSVLALLVMVRCRRDADELVCRVRLGKRTLDRVAHGG
jgi:hypothetical protein